MTEPMTEPTRDLVDREELRREFAEAGDHTHTPKWRTAFRHARAVLDTMPSVECPRGWTRDEVLHELDTLPGAVCEWRDPYNGRWYGVARATMNRWHPEVRRYDVRVTLPPVTVWVPLTKLVGRTLAGKVGRVESYNSSGREGVVAVLATGQCVPLIFDESGRVEVLAEGDA